jgi:hypothetical protein
MIEPTAVRPTLVAAGWQPKFGLALLVLSVASPLFVPMVLASDLAPQVKAALAGLLLFGVPMGLLVIVIGLIGEPAFLFINRRVGGHASAAYVSVMRYRIGLGLLALGVLVSWIEPLVSPHAPQLAARRVLVGTLADGVVLVSLFVLGGAFWDKVHALFVHDACVVPDTASAGKTAVATPVKVGWRFYAGVAVIVCSFGSWGLVPVASAAGWSTAQIASLSGAIFIGSKVGLITAIAIMGKDGFNYMKQVVFGVLRKFGPAQEVSLGRYRLGLFLFMVPVLMTWAAPYVTGFVQEGSVYGFLQGISLEALLLVGLFLLGGGFWDKARALFQQRARVEIPRG